MMNRARRIHTTSLFYLILTTTIQVIDAASSLAPSHLEAEAEILDSRCNKLDLEYININ